MSNPANEIHVEGRLTADPVKRDFSNGGSCVDFTVAVDRSFKSAGGERKTDFIPCRLGGKRWEPFLKYFHKGDAVHIVGELHLDKMHGTVGESARIFTIVSVDDWAFVPKQAANTQPKAETYSQPQMTELQPDEMDGQLPF